MAPGGGSFQSPGLCGWELSGISARSQVSQRLPSAGLHPLCPRYCRRFHAFCDQSGGGRAAHGEVRTATTQPGVRADLPGGEMHGRGGFWSTPHATGAGGRTVTRKGDPTFSSKGQAGRRAGRPWAVGTTPGHVAVPARPSVTGGGHVSSALRWAGAGLPRGQPLPSEGRPHGRPSCRARTPLPDSASLRTSDQGTVGPNSSLDIFSAEKVGGRERGGD